MNQQNIKTFLAIAEHQSISAAARVLYTSQPAVSAQLNSLEKELGMQLVLRERGARKAHLTAAGSAFLPLAQQWMELEGRITQFKQTRHRNVLRVAASISGHEYIVSHIIHKMMRHNPEIELQISIIEGRELPLFIEEQRFDLAFYLGFAPKHPNAYIKTLFDEERHIICPADTPLPNRPISPGELDPSFEIRYNNFGLAGDTAAWRDRFFPQITAPYFSVDRLMIAHQYLNDPRCWTIMPTAMALALVQAKPDKFALRYFAECPPPPRPCQAVISKFYPETTIIQKLLTCCDEYVDETPYLHRPSIY